MESARLPCCADLVEVVAQGIGQLGDFAARLIVGRHPPERLLQFVDQLDRDAREVVHEIERVLDLVGDARRQLTKRGELLCLDKAILSGAQVLKRFRQFPGALLLRFKQPRILDGDHSLVGEGLSQLDLLKGERSRCGAS